MPPRTVLLGLILAGAGFAQRPAPQVIFGGSGDDSIHAAAVDAAGNVYVVGTTLSFDLPVRNAFQTANSGTQLIASADAGATWRPVGTPFPSVTPLQPLAMAVDPTNAQVVYLAAGNSLCKSTNGGSQFECATIAFASSQTTISSLVIDAQQPQTLYLSATVNGGVFKSTDGGQTWANASQGLPSQGFIDSVTIDPFHPNVLWAWAGSGGYVSTNGAETWSVSAMPWPQNTSVSGGLSFSFDPVTPGILYGPAFPVNQLGVQKSTDGGATWSLLNTPFSSCCVVPDPQVSCVLYQVAQLYSATGNSSGPVQFWKSIDGGATWTSSAVPAELIGPLAVDPANPRILVAGDFRSTDGGQTWTPTNASRQIQPVFAPSAASVVYATAPISSDAFLAKFLPDGKTLVFSTYFGGMGSDAGQGIALDAEGNIWITGTTSSYDLPVTPGAFQTALKGAANAFVAKFSEDGKLLAATYLGGSNDDGGLGVAIGPQGNPWLTGLWNSTDFPFTATALAPGTNGGTGFLAELDPTAARLLYAASAGGTLDANGKGMALDSAGNIVLVGSTYGAFPITPGAFQGGTANPYSPKVFVMKVSAAGQVIYATSFGGTEAAPTPGGYEAEHDYGVAVAVDGAGNAYVTGYTSGADFPVTPGAYQTAFAAGCPYPAFSIDTGMIGTISEWYVDDVFVVKLSADGTTALYSTLLGGSCYDRASSIALDASGQVYVAGETDSGDFPAVDPVTGAPATGQFASFLSVLNPAGSGLTFSTYLYAGANPDVVVAPGGRTLVAGTTGSGAQSQPFSGFVNPFPASATDGYLVFPKPLGALRGRQ